MFPSLKKRGLLIIIVFFTQPAFSQELFPHSLSAGLGVGVSAEGYSNTAKTVFGLNLSHQRNWSRFFSFRTHLGVNYFMPDKNIVNYPMASEERVEQAVNTALVISPLFYYRKGDVSLFVGPGLGVGNQSDFVRTTTIINGESDVDDRRYHAFLLVFKPSLGASFYVGESKDEIEIELAPNIWMDIEDLDFSSLMEQMGWFSVTISYRFNFNEG